MSNIDFVLFLIDIWPRPIATESAARLKVLSTNAKLLSVSIQYLRGDASSPTMAYNTLVEEKAPLLDSHTDTWFYVGGARLTPFETVEKVYIRW